MAVGDRHKESPKACPKCKSKLIKPVPETSSGLKPWRCEKCGAIGYDGRVIGDTITVGVEKTRKRRTRKFKSDRFG